jgi:gliding motility-associated-like protein
MVTSSSAQDIDISKLTIIHESCQSSNGSITGIVGPSDFAYRWSNGVGSNVSTTLDLVGIRDGSYRLYYTNPATGVTKAYGPVVVKDLTNLIDERNVKIVNSACNQATGSITNLSFTEPDLKFNWVKKDDISFESPLEKDLINASAGVYTLTVTNRQGCSSSGSFTISENSDIVIDHANVAITNAQCGMSNGSITNINVSSNFPTSYSWRNQDNHEVANTANLVKQPPGIYKLYITGGLNGTCVSTYGPQIIGSDGGLTIDSSQFVKIAANCTRASASIRGIHVVGKGLITYKWYLFTDSDTPQIVSTSKDLINVTGGSYAVQVTDQSGCEPVFSKIYKLPSYTGFKFYPELVKVSVASCDSYASITGVAEQQSLTGLLKYEWRKPNLDLVSTKPNLTGLPGGKYFLFVSELCGNKPTLQFSFDMGDNTTTFNGIYRYTLKNSCMLQNTGSITIDAYPLGIQKMRWVNSNGDNFALGPSIEKLAPGNYTLYVTDELGCERLYSTFPVVAAAPVQIVEGSGNINADTCNTGTGSITNLQFVNGYPPFFYTWKDANGKIVSQTADAVGLGAGNYTLSVTDGTGCDGPFKTFTIANVNVGPPAPVVTDVYICSSGEAIFRVIGPKAGSRYRLYENAYTFTPIDEQANGEFRIKVMQDREFYVSRIRGDCEGPRTRMLVKIGLIIADLTNVFTPNGDGINDFWKINNIEKYTDALVQVYSRSGQLVYQSRGYGTPFAGVYNGKVLSSGIYYYIITLDRNCRVMGNVTIMR